MVLSSAGAYVSGAAGSNECPAGSVRIETQAACSAAATAVGRSFNLVVTSSSDPRGCAYSTMSLITNRAYFNADAVGTGEPGLQLLCSGAARVSHGRLKHHRVLWVLMGYSGSPHTVQRPAGVRVREAADGAAPDGQRTQRIHARDVC